MIRGDGLEFLVTRRETSLKTFDLFGGECEFLFRLLEFALEFGMGGDQVFYLFP